MSSTGLPVVPAPGKLMLEGTRSQALPPNLKSLSASGVVAGPVASRGQALLSCGERRGEGPQSRLCSVACSGPSSWQDLPGIAEAREGEVGQWWGREEGMRLSGIRGDSRCEGSVTVTSAQGLLCASP